MKDKTNLQQTAEEILKADPSVQIAIGSKIVGLSCKFHETGTCTPVNRSTCAECVDGDMSFSMVENLNYTKLVL